jgi:hypothetical protein
VKIVRKHDKLTTSVYRKETDFGRYLHFKSNHPRSVKIVVASCLLQRAETHCNEEQEKQKEISRVKSTLKIMYNPKMFFAEIEKKSKKRRNRTSKEKRIQGRGGHSIRGRCVRSH